MQQERAQLAAPLGPEQTHRLMQPRQRLLRTLEFLESGGPIELAQRRRVRKVMIADPVPFRAGPLGDRCATGRADLLAEHEESHPYVAPSQAFEHRRSD